jgi:hypothetical protein
LIACGVEFRQPLQRRTVVEQAGVEEIRRKPPGLGRELTKAQHVFSDSKLDEFLTKVHTAFL